MKNLALILVIALAIYGCAQTGPPDGGPEDKTPPLLLETIPAQGSTNVDTSTTITLIFDEAVSQSTLRSAFGLSPPPPGVVRAEWSGNKEVELRFEPGLKPDRTYALTIGTQLSDENRNQLDDTIVLAFSTGDSLDTGWLRGLLVTDGELVGWNIAGYHLADSTIVPDPSVDVPDATTQTGKDGSWQLSNLRVGQWRVFAFKDTDADRLWTPWLDQLAVPPYDVQAAPDSTTQPRELVMRSSQPILLPQPQRVSALRKDFFLLRLDRQPLKLEADYSLTELPAPEEGDAYPEDWEINEDDFTIPVFSRSFKPGDSTVVQLGLERIPEGDATGLRIFGSFGTVDTLDTVLAVDLANAALEDTLFPTLVSVEPEDRARMHLGQPHIRFTFSEPVRYTDSTGLRLLKGTEDTLYPSVSRPYPNRLAFSIADTTSGGSITVELFGSSIADLAGNTLQDSVLTYRYAWLPPDSLGVVSGSVTAPSDDAVVHLIFNDVLGKQLPIKLSVPGSSDFTVPNVPAGSWQVEGWQDVSRTLKWFPGTAVPFAPADPMVVTRDTIDVRARWETGGVEIIFP